MNRKKAVYVTDADIDQVKKDLLSGNSSLRLPQFDNLISASDNDVDEITKEDSEAVLRAIALLNACLSSSPISLLELEEV